MLWNRNDLLQFRFRFLLWKSFGSGSGSDSGSSSGSWLFSRVFQEQEMLQNLTFSMLGAALFSRKLASTFRFFYFCITFYVGSGSRSGTGTRSRTGMHYTSGSAKAKKIAVTAVPVPQHWFNALPVAWDRLHHLLADKPSWVGGRVNDAKDRVQLYHVANRNRIFNFTHSGQ
jgi:hypothetical protein